jgi:hypothetical protein
VIVGFCLNDACTTTTDLGAYRESLTSIARESRARTAAAILFLTPKNQDCDGCGKEYGARYYHDLTFQSSVQTISANHL